MERAEFDKFAEEYQLLHEANLALSGEKPEYFAHYKIKDLRRIVEKFAPWVEAGRILDLGAGIGTSVPHFRRYFPATSLTCIDVSLKSLRIGTGRFGGMAAFVAFDGKKLPFPDGVFDCVFVACVFHHISADHHIALLVELRRILKPGGLLMLFEHNPWNPLTVHAVNTCPFDENAVLISAKAMNKAVCAAGFDVMCIHFRLFFPKVMSFLRPLERCMLWLPLGAQYYVCGRR